MENDTDKLLRLRAKRDSLLLCSSHRKNTKRWKREWAQVNAELKELVDRMRQERWRKLGIA